MNRRTRRAMSKGKLKKLNDVTTQVENAIANMPKKCTKCDKDFKMSDKDQLDDWNIEVYLDGTVKLTCLMCTKNNSKEQTK
tara:strand:- start:639 stop:881 length:243 start_codon:yes stop_codon:yes gene_type:complete